MPQHPHTHTKIPYGIGGILTSEPLAGGEADLQPSLFARVSYHEYSHLSRTFFRIIAKVFSQKDLFIAE